METITIRTVIDEKRRIMIDLPDDAPLGEVELVINFQPANGDEDVSAGDMTREQARAKLIAAGLVSVGELSPDEVDVSGAELARLRELFAAEQPIADLIDQERKERL